jgi:hypothetical protein
VGPPRPRPTRRFVSTVADSSAAAAPPVEWEMATDMVRRSLPFTPAPLVVGALFHGVDGALSAAFGVVLVLANLVAAGGLMVWGARRSLGVLAGVAVGGFALRLAVLVLAVSLVKDLGWVELVPLGLTVVVGQVGLLWWETRHVSLSLAYPGLKPPLGRS